MFREVTLVDHRPGEEPVFEVVHARPVGRAYTWCDPTRVGVGGVSLLFKGEDGRWFIQQINHFPDPFRFFAIYFSFTSFDDLCYTFPDEVSYILPYTYRL
jgi:hypothetical protein